MLLQVARVFAVAIFLLPAVAFACPWHGGGGGWGRTLGPRDFDYVSAFDAPEVRGETLQVQSTDHLRGTSKDYTPGEDRLELPEAAGYSCAVARSGVAGREKFPVFELTCKSKTGAAERPRHDCSPESDHAAEQTWNGVTRAGMTAVSVTLLCT